MLLHLVRIPGNGHFVGAEPESVLLLVLRGSEDHVRSQRMSKLHAHVTQTDLVRGVKGERQVPAEILKSSFATWAGAVRVDQAADRGEVAGIVSGDSRADVGDTP